MDVWKRIVSLRHGGTLNSRQTASSLVRLVDEDERWEVSNHPQGVFPQNWGETDPNRTVTCIVLKAKANDRNTTSFLPTRNFVGLDLMLLSIRWRKLQQQQHSPSLYIWVDKYL
ncbi:uncharacterized protein TNCV_346701 [Trichonephila clavipes]|nr:uncharacterized protein TNCV_346701 [Trichonephila clavipes]